MNASVFADAISDYVAHLRARGCLPKTCHVAQYLLDALRACLKEHHHIEDPRDVREEHLVAFAHELKRRQGRRGVMLSPATQAHYIRTAAAFFTFLAKRGTLLQDPAAEITVPEFERLPRAVLTTVQAARLMNAPSPYSQLGKRDRAILELLYGAGLRREECVRLDVTDVDLQQARLLIRNGKGRQDRVVPIPGRALVALECYLVEVRPEYIADPRERALFIGLGHRGRGGRLSANGVYKVVVDAARHAGLGHVHPHVLRHTCATHVLQGGADVRHVQELLGHRGLRSTQIYTRVNAADLKAAIERCHPRERKRRRGSRQYNKR